MTDPRKAKRSVRAIVSLAVGVAMIAAIGAMLVQRPSCRAKDTHWTPVHFDAPVP